MATQAEIAVLRGTATQVKNESQVGGNTAGRVGGLFEGIVDALPSDEAIDGKITQAVAGIQPIVIEGNVDNAPDQEDLTSVNQGGTDVLKFKDKTYSPALFSGLGRVYLRKNVVTPENLGYAVNLLTAEMVSQPNTIYHIQYDYDLNGQTITLQTGCVLQFDGGSIKNGKINGDNSFISANNTGIFDNVELGASWRNDEFALEWWVVSTATDYDNSLNVQCAVYSASRVRRLSVSGKYGISSPIWAYTTKICSKAINNFKDMGFVANSDFAGKSVTISGTSYNVSGMFYFDNNKNPQFSHIIIDANDYADFGVQHVAGYANVDFDNVEVYKAKKIGVLQYGCERPTWRNLLCSGCNIGAFISSLEYDETNFPFFTKNVSKGSPNLVSLFGCRFTGCNFGLILKSGTNTSLYDCETAHNSLFGVECVDANVLFVNYYSEGDGTANFYLYPDGTKEYNPSGNSYTSQYLIDNSHDGIPSLEPNRTTFDSVAYMRSIIYAYDSRVHLVRSFYSFKPRSHKIDDSSAEMINEPTLRDAAGIDVIILSDKSKIIDENSYLYNHTLQGAGNPWMCIYVISGQISNKDNIVLKGMMNTLGVEGNSAIYSIYEKKETPFDCGAFYYGGKMPEYNNDINTRIYGISSNALPMNCHKLKGQYNGIPLYKRNTSFSQRGMLNFSRAKLTEVFGNVEYVKARVVAWLPQQATTRFSFGYRYLNSGYSMVSAAFSVDTGAKRLQNAGFYDFVFPVRLAYKAAEWAYLSFNLSIDDETTVEAYVSDVFLYDIADPVMKVPFIEHPTIVRGVTKYRPYLPDKGQRYYDTTLSKWIEWDGTQWVDNTGTAV